MWDYRVLGQFKQARLGNKIITFDDLVRERMIENDGEELHCWVAKKEKREYLLSNSVIKELPIKIISTQDYTEKTNIFHFVSDYAHIGFAPEKSYEFRQLIGKFFDVSHNNPKHFLLLKIIAFASHIGKLNTRICSNIEFLKDGTFEVLNYLTNSVAVFDKPRTMAKLEYGVVNSVLVVNELVPKSAEEKHSINEFLLSIGSLKPIYQKTTRGSAAFSTKDCYNIENLSLVICYNTLNEVADADRENYFDFVFGENVKQRYMPFKFSGKVDMSQFLAETPYTLEIDNELLKMARTIEWYKQNYKKEIKPFAVDLSKLILSERYKHSLLQIVNFINLYAETEDEFKMLVNELLDCHYAYKRMLNSSNLITDYSQEQRPSFSNNDNDFEQLAVETEELFDNTPETANNTQINPLNIIKALDIGEGVLSEEIALKMGLAVGEIYPELERLSRNGDIYEHKPDRYKVLE